MEVHLAGSGGTKIPSGAEGAGRNSKSAGRAGLALPKNSDSDGAVLGGAGAEAATAQLDPGVAPELSSTRHGSPRYVGNVTYNPET